MLLFLTERGWILPSDVSNSIKVERAFHGNQIIPRKTALQTWIDGKIRRIDRSPLGIQISFMFLFFDASARKRRIFNILTA